MSAAPEIEIHGHALACYRALCALAAQRAGQEPGAVWLRRFVAACATPRAFAEALPPLRGVRDLAAVEERATVSTVLDYLVGVPQFPWAFETAYREQFPADPAPAADGEWVGEVMRVGTMQVSGEEITGVVVAMPREVLAARRRTPLYRQVRLVPVEDVR